MNDLEPPRRLAPALLFPGHTVCLHSDLPPPAPPLLATRTSNRLLASCETVEFPCWGARAPPLGAESGRVSVRSDRSRAASFLAWFGERCCQRPPGTFSPLGILPEEGRIPRQLGGPSGPTPNLCGDPQGLDGWCRAGVRGSLNVSDKPLS